MSMSSKGLSLNSESITMRPDEFASEEDHVRAARMALCLAETAEQAAEFLAVLDVDPHWLKKYVDTHGWPQERDRGEATDVA